MRRIAVLSGALLLGACTGGSSVGPSARPTSPRPLASTEPTPVFEPEDEVLSVAIRDPATLDPMLIGNPGATLVARQLYEGLTRWDPVEEKVLPAAAEGWVVEDEGRRFVFRLRDGMTFHDGSPVRARDFIFAFDRIAQKTNASEIAYALEPILGFAEVNQEATSDHLIGLSAPDDLTLTIDLAYPYQDLPIVLTHPALVPLPRHAVDDYDTFLSSPTGNGPFKIARPWVSGAPLELEAFTGSVDTPQIDGIRFLPYADAAASWLRFTDGEIDVAEVPQGQIEAAAEAAGDRGFQPFLSALYLGFNLDAPGLSRKALRKAINLAIDRERIARHVFNGNMQPPRGIVPAGMPGFRENICVGVCEYLPEAAERIVLRLPPRARRVSIQSDDGPPHHRVVEMVKRDLEAVGLRVGVRRFPFPQYLKILRRDLHHVFRFGWLAEYPSPDVYLRELFGAGSLNNHSGLSSPRVGSLLDAAHREGSQDRRTQLYIAAEKTILRDLPVVPIGSFVIRWAAHPWVTQIAFDALGGFDAVDVVVDRGSG